ncbi:MAG: bis(5'-nucleosyl)-tetraphosphatase (symmetrical) YqeK [Clostridia bacterium]|nr:bis(5'-nucleosyl)-tetraphosphatase (symmetrical) YqeK [Clostridia bacterium]
MTKEQMKEKLGELLTDHRYSHSLGVVETAVKMAEIFGANVEKTEIAALLHDCAKQIPHTTQLEMCKEYGIPLDEVKEKELGLLHAELGAYMAERDFGITDTEILDAIRYHTLGRERMTTMEKILYLADIVEPNRKEFEGLAELRQLCFKDLDRALLYGFGLTISHTNRRGHILHNQTIDAEKYIREKLRKEENILDQENAFEKAALAVKVLDKKKAADVKLLKVSDLTILADYFIICSAGSSTQVKALADNVEDEFAKEGIHPIAKEGKGGNEWMLLDYGDVIIHIFYKEMREFYGLDKLWNDAQSIDINAITAE